MKAVICAVVVGLLASGTTVSGPSPGNQKKGKAKHATDERREVEARPGVSIRVVFSPRERTVIREHYAPRYRNLPPGLQKKLARTGQLPPGWRKKMEPFPAAVDRDLVALPAGYGRGVIDGHAVIYDTRTQVILDVAVLF